MSIIKYLGIAGDIEDIRTPVKDRSNNPYFPSPKPINPVDELKPVKPKEPKPEIPKVPENPNNPKLDFPQKQKPTEPQKPEAPKDKEPQEPKMPKEPILQPPTKGQDNKDLSNFFLILKKTEDPNKIFSVREVLKRDVIIEKIVKILNKKDLYFIVTLLYEKYEKNELTKSTLLIIWEKLAKQPREIEYKNLKARLAKNPKLKNFIDFLQKEFFIKNAGGVVVREKKETNNSEKPKYKNTSHTPNSKKKMLMYMVIAVLAVYILKHKKNEK